MSNDNQELALENWLNRATNPVNREEDWEFIMGFCDQINQELEGPQIACPLIAHKIQSPQERESLLALSTLEACVKNCGRRFHLELGKFRFLNELIKVISPKYYGSRTSEAVKKKCIELLYSWSKGLTHETKILEAYTMLKSQSIIKEDPVYMDSTLYSPTLEKSKNSIFEDDEKSKLLARLLKSRSPEDLQSANRLIKNMVKEDNDRMDRVSRRLNEIEKMSNNMKLLSEMIDHYAETSASQADKDMMKELFDTLEKNRPILFKLASETDEKDNEGINDILRTNDEMMKVMNHYKNRVMKVGDGDPHGQDDLLDLDLVASPQDTPTQSQPTVTDSTAILQQQLSHFGLDDANTSTSNTLFSRPPTNTGIADLNNIFTDFQNFNTQQQVPQPMNNPPMGLAPQYQFQRPMFPSATPVPASPTYSALFANSGLPPAYNTPVSQTRLPTQAGATSNNSMDDLKALGEDWLTQKKTAPPSAAAPMLQPGQQHHVELSHSLIQPTTQPLSTLLIQPVQSLKQPLVNVAQAISRPQTQPTVHDNLPSYPVIQPTPLAQPAQPSLLGSPQAAQHTSIAMTTPLVHPTSPSLHVTPSMPFTSPSVSPANLSSPTGSAATPSLADISVSLDTIKPGAVEPIKAYEKNGVKIMIHFGKDSPRPDVTVMVVSVMSTKTGPVSGFTFQAAVPKVMKVKLQPPSATDLPSYNPILPPSAITQVMILANPLNEKVRLKFKLKYTMDEKEVTDFGEVDGFPKIS